MASSQTSGDRDLERNGRYAFPENNTAEIFALKNAIEAVEDRDLESNDQHAFLENNTVQNLAWKDVTVTVKDRETKKPKKILFGASGHVSRGKMESIHMTLVSMF